MSTFNSHTTPKFLNKLRKLLKNLKTRNKNYETKIKVAHKKAKTEQFPRQTNTTP